MLKQSLFVAFLALTALATAQTAAKKPSAVPTKVTGPGTVTPDGLRYWDIKVGTGATANATQTVTVHYTGWLTNGKKFDSSHDRGEPIKFALGRGQVIKGWDEGIEGMKTGGKRQLRIPAALGYGAHGTAGIPPNATLIFDVELVRVQ